MHLWTGCQDAFKEIRQEEVCILRIGLMHIYYSIYFQYLVLFVIYLLSLDKLEDLLTYFGMRVRHSISAKLLYTCETVGVWIGKWLLNEATTNNIASQVSLAKIGSYCKI